MILRPAALRPALRLDADGICSRCLSRLSRQSNAPSPYRSSIHTKRKIHGAIVPDKQVQKNMMITPQTLVNNYFSANTSLDRGWLSNGLMAAWRTVQEPAKTQGSQGEKQIDLDQAINSDLSENPPALMETVPESIDTPSLPAQSQAISRTEASSSLASTASTAAATAQTRPRRRRQTDPNSTDPIIPPDASSQLTTAAASLPKSASFRRTLTTFLSLSKPRLSILVVLTTTTAYSLYPIPDILSTTTSLAPTTLSTSTLTLMFLTTGTFLSSAAANTLNMLMEPKHDAQMSRTRNRPLVRNLVSVRAAGLFALACGVTGLTLLDLGTNSTVAFLSALNIFLYAGVYTPLKRISVLNTWVGALVGGIPPLMGWAAAAGQAATSEHHSWRDLLFADDSAGGWLLAALLFAWQFPHFNAIAHGIRHEYQNAGFRMLAWTNPARSARVALRYSLAMFPICAGLYWVGIVNEGFLVISTACNLWMTREAVKFWRRGGAGGSARGLFWASVWQLPLVMVGALVCKKGIWEGVWDDSKNPTRADSDSAEAAILDGEETDDDEDEGDQVDDQGRRTRKQRQKPPVGIHPADINLAMLGFKRPS